VASCAGQAHTQYCGLPLQLHMQEHGKKQTQTFLSLLRDHISRSFTEMFLEIFQTTVPEKDAQINEQQTS